MATIVNPQGSGNGINGNQNLTDQGTGLNLQQQQGGNPSNDMFAGFESDEDRDLNDLLSGFGDDVNTDFEVTDDWLTPANNGGDGTDGGDDSDGADEGQGLMEELQNMMKQITIDDSSLPDDFDWQDRTKVKGLLNHTAQKAAVSALAMLTKPMKVYVESVAKQLRDEMNKTVKKGGIQGKIEEAFEPFKTQLGGEKNKARLSFAAQTFKQALQANKDPRKAAVTTMKMLKQLGINVQVGRQGNTGGNESFNSQRFEGAAALDDLFGSNK